MVSLRGILGQLSATAALSCRRVLSMSQRSHTYYSPEQKAEIISGLKNHEYSVQEANRRFGVPVPTLYSWCKGFAPKRSVKLTPKRIDALVKSGIPPRPSLGSKVDRVTEMYLLGMAKVEGVDSSLLCEACRRHGVKLEDLRRLLAWGAQYGGSGIDFLGAHEIANAQQQDEIKQLKDDVAERDFLIRELAQSNERKNSVIAIFAEDYVLKKAQAMRKV